MEGRTTRTRSTAAEAPSPATLALQGPILIGVSSTRSLAAWSRGTYPNPMYIPVFSVASNDDAVWLIEHATGMQNGQRVLTMTWSGSVFDLETVRRYLEAAYIRRLPRLRS